MWGADGERVKVVYRGDEYEYQTPGELLAQLISGYNPGVDLDDSELKAALADRCNFAVEAAQAVNFGMGIKVMRMGENADGEDAQYLDDVSSILQEDIYEIAENDLGEWGYDVPPFTTVSFLYKPFTDKTITGNVNILHPEDEAKFVAELIECGYLELLEIKSID